MKSAPMEASVSREREIKPDSRTQFLISRGSFSDMMGVFLGMETYVEPQIDLVAETLDGMVEKLYDELTEKEKNYIQQHVDTLNTCSMVLRNTVRIIHAYQREAHRADEVKCQTK